MVPPTAAPGPLPPCDGGVGGVGCTGGVGAGGVEAGVGGEVGAGGFGVGVGGIGGGVGGRGGVGGVGGSVGGSVGFGVGGAVGGGVGGGVGTGPGPPHAPEFAQSEQSQSRAFVHVEVASVQPEVALPGVKQPGVVAFQHHCLLSSATHWSHAAAVSPHEVSVHDAHWHSPESAHTAPLKEHSPARTMHVCESQHHSWPLAVQLSHVSSAGSGVGGVGGGVGTGPGPPHAPEFAQSEQSQSRAFVHVEVASLQPAVASPGAKQPGVVAFQHHCLLSSATHWSHVVAGGGVGPAGVGVGGGVGSTVLRRHGQMVFS
jgi:hypothetical protein